jgi:diphosphomevalonate decarboxylase
MKHTAVAAANIALIKYWGTQDAERVLPANPSLSMTLRHCVSRCTVAPGENGKDDVSWLSEQGELETPPPAFLSGVLQHIERLRAYGGARTSLRVVTTNNFPTGAGIASSASGFAALTIAVCRALGYDADSEALSRLARLSGSGSAARSVLGGYVEWPGLADDPESGARQIASERHWRLHDLIAVVNTEHKRVSSREGHRRASTSPYFATRLEHLPARHDRVRSALLARDFGRLAQAVEEEAIDLHLIAMSATPPTFYWQPATLAVLEAVRRWRDDGLEVCATIDAGPNVHVLCTDAHVAQVREALDAVAGVNHVIADEVGDGPRIVEEHLF